MNIAVTVTSVGSIGAKKSYYEVRYGQSKIIVQMQECDEQRGLINNSVDDAARRMIESLPLVRHGEWVGGVISNNKTVFCYKSAKKNSLWIF